MGIIQEIEKTWESLPCGGWQEEMPPPDHVRFSSDYIRHLLRAMQASNIPAGTHGLWEVRKRNVPAYLMLCKGAEYVPCTELFRSTLATLNQDHGELVMVDHWIECKTHLEFILKAKGRILITGLGLGCVVRGLVSHGKATSITVIERDQSVIKLVGSWMPPTIQIIHADIRDWAKSNREKYDYAWHDLWSDKDTEEPHLQAIHAEIIFALSDYIRYQGAWKLPRFFRRVLEDIGKGLNTKMHKGDPHEPRLRR